MIKLYANTLIEWKPNELPRSRGARYLKEFSFNPDAEIIEEFFWLNYYKDSALDQKYKELIAVGAAVATRCIPCLANHASNAISNGATREEIIDAAAIGVEFGGGPSFVVVKSIGIVDLLSSQTRTHYK